MDKVEEFRAQKEVVREDLRELGQIGRQLAHEKVEGVRKAARDFEGRLADHVREQPLKSLLIAAGVGAVLGVLWSRR
jgi:ElaB/YqjD/DUF883 family membrane-anchored ribosome-binding protein